MKSNFKKLLSLCLMMSMVIASTAACSNQDNPADKTADSAASEEAVKSSSEEQTKYGNVEVYENDSGTPSAKTEDGEEVELTGESMQEIYAQYEKVRGTGSQEEKELLDKLQLILEAPKQ